MAKKAKKKTNNISTKPKIPVITPKRTGYHKLARRLISSFGMQNVLDTLLECFSIRNDHAVLAFNKFLKNNQMTAKYYCYKKSKIPEAIINVQYAEFAAHMLNRVFAPIYQCLPPDDLFMWSRDMFVSEAKISTYEVGDKLYQTHIECQWIMEELVLQYLKQYALFSGLLEENYESEHMLKIINDLVERLQAVRLTYPKKERLKPKIPTEVLEDIEKYQLKIYQPIRKFEVKMDRPIHQVKNTIPTFDFAYESKPQKLSTQTTKNISGTISKRSINTKSQDNRKKLYIFTNLSITSCNAQKHKVIESSLPLLSVIEHHYIDVPVHKCLTCKRTFISEEMWKLYMKHGIEHVYYVQHETDFDAFRKESQLHSLGYRVGAKGMDMYERRLFLMDVIRRKQMTLFEIERYCQCNKYSSE